jgi:hypothetical protein
MKPKSKSTATINAKLRRIRRRVSQRRVKGERI